MFFLVYFAGGLFSGICKTRVEPHAVRLLYKVNRDYTGRLSRTYFQHHLDMIKRFYVHK